MRSGVDAWDAYQIDGVLSRVRFECGAGFHGSFRFRLFRPLSLAVVNYANDAIACVQRTKTDYAQDVSFPVEKVLTYIAWSSLYIVEFLENLGESFSSPLRTMRTRLRSRETPMTRRARES